MTSFKFTYHEKECSGIYLPSERGKGWLKVIFFEHSAVIMPTLIQRVNQKRVWVQTINTGEAVWPHDLIQAIGEAIESVQPENR
jgi:hypothetical protein